MVGYGRVCGGMGRVEGSTNLMPAVSARRARWALVATAMGTTCLLLVALVAFGPLQGCQAIPPSELPSGAPPGGVTLSVYAGGNLYTWGAGEDRVRLIVGPDFRGATEFVPAMVRGREAEVFDFPAADGSTDTAIAWTSGACSYTALLDPGTTSSQAVAFASRY